MTLQVEQSHRNPRAAQLGARYSLLLHSILFGVNLIQEGVHDQPYRDDDERSDVFAAAALNIYNQADELDTMGKILLPLKDSTETREFLMAAHADTLVRLQRSWDVAYNRLRWPAVELPDRAARELDRTPKDTFACAPNVDLGARYADLTYWAVGALRDLHLSARHPNRHEGDEEASLKNEIRNARALLLAVEQAGGHFESLEDGRAAAVLVQFDAQTRFRTRMFANDVRNRLQPLRR